MSAKLKLLEPLSLGDLKLANRIFMAPLTRCRASAGRVPNAMMRDYYVQRGSGVDSYRGDVRYADGRGLPEHAGHLVAGTDGGVEADHDGGA